MQTRRQLLSSAFAVTALAGFGCLAAGSGLAATATALPPLSDQDKADVARVEAYLNSFKTMTGNFLQVAPDGSLSDGKLYLRRPGRLRFEYAPPSPVLVVADGVWVIFHDKQLGQTDRVPLGSTPLATLVQDDIKLNGRVRVRGVQRSPGALRITMFDSDKPEEGRLVLVFSDKPLELRQWQVTDAQAQITTLTISNVELNQPLSANLFAFGESAPSGLDKAAP